MKKIYLLRCSSFAKIFLALFITLALLLLGSACLHLPLSYRGAAEGLDWDALPLPGMCAEATGGIDADGYGIYQLRVYEQGWKAADDYQAFLKAHRPLALYTAGMRARGKSSLVMPKKSYALELRDPAKVEASKNAAFCGLPADNDFVLHAAYADKSLLRNYSAYRLAAHTGNYAPRVRFVELYLKNTLDLEPSYEGIYLLTEKIKPGKNRVNISKMGKKEQSPETLSGGYLLKIDKWELGQWYCPGLQAKNLSVFEPNAEDISQAQQDYISSYLLEMEAALCSVSAIDPERGYQAYLDPESFMDFLLVNELCRNIDGFRFSSYMSKDRSGRLRAGPVWDFDIALGNADYHEGMRPDGYLDDPLTPENEAALGWVIVHQLHPSWNDSAPLIFRSDATPPFWWRVMLSDPGFRVALRSRYLALRKEPWSDARLLSLLEEGRASFEGGLSREFKRWNRLASPDWPNPWPIPWNEKDPQDYGYEDHYRYLRDWLLKRAAWMDSSHAWQALDEWATQ